MKKTSLLGSAALITAGMALAGCDQQKKESTPKKPTPSQAASRVNAGVKLSDNQSMTSSAPKNPCSPSSSTEPKSGATANPCAAAKPSATPSGNPCAMKSGAPSPSNPCAAAKPGATPSENPCAMKPGTTPPSQPPA